MEILKETKKYIYYKDCIYSKNCYKMLKVYTTAKYNLKYSILQPDGEFKRRMYYFDKK